MKYAEQIEQAANHVELKAIGAKLFNAKLSEEKKNELITLYREKRREIDRVMVDNTTNTTLKRVLYVVNTMAKEGAAEVAKTGKQIYELTKTGMLDQFEADLVFRAYRHQKKKAGIEFQPVAPF
jgi:hypothetical protein